MQLNKLQYLTNRQKICISYLLILIFWMSNIATSYYICRYAFVGDSTYTTHLIIIFVLYFIVATVTIQYLIFKDQAYLYYILYLHVNILYFTLVFSNQPLILIHLPEWHDPGSGLLSVPLLALLYFFYTLFAIRFLSIQKTNIKVYKILSWLAGILASLFVISVLNIGIAWVNEPLYSKIRYYTLLCFMPIGIVSIIFIFRYVKTTIARIFIAGSVCFTIGSIYGFLLANEIIPYPTSIPPFDDWVFYTEIATLIEVILFTSCFTYRNKLLMLEDQRTKDELVVRILENQEKEKRLQNIRNDIAANLHDDIGSTLSNVNILTELAKRNTTENPGKSFEYLEKASDDINRISESLGDIVWNINPRYDSIENLFLRMKHYAGVMLEGNDIAYTLELPSMDEPIKMDMNKRRDLYLIFKEAINNLGKYSQASTAFVHMKIESNNIILTIKDNGIGFDPEFHNSGNGIYNMHKRSTASAGTFVIKSAPGKGTAIVCSIPITSEA